MQQEDAGKVPLKGILKKGDPKLNNEKWVDGMNYPNFAVKGRVTPQSNDNQPNPEVEKLKLYARKLKMDFEAIQKKLDSEVKSAYVKGLEEGRGQGLKQGQDQSKAKFDNDLSVLKENLATAFIALSGEKQEFFKDIQEGAVSLVLTMFKRLVGDCADHYHDFVLNTVLKGVELLGKEEKILIRINPSEVEHVQKNQEFWNPINSHIQDVQIEGDSRIQKGGCIIESSNGTIDMRMDMMEAMLEDAFKKVHDNMNNQAL